MKYLFDAEGNFLKQEHWFGGTTSSFDRDRMESEKQKMLSGLGEYELCEIEVKPFQIEINGHTFGLIPNHECNSIDLMPGNTISFREPWDGEYDT